jgi:hypothetical protein
MTPKKTTPLFLVIFTLMCALPAAGEVVLPSAIAQQDDEDHASLLDDDNENLATGIVSDVLDGGSGGDNDDNEEENDNGGAAARGDTNIQVAVPITDQDQTAENRAVNLDLNIIEEEAPPLTPPTPDEEEDGVFCFAFEGDVGFAQAFCFETRAECEEGRIVTESRPPFTPTQECREFATIPPGGGNCRVVDDEVRCDPV